MRLPFIGNYPVTRPFGVYDVAYSAYPDSKHPGTDYAVPNGYPLIAAITGTVEVIERGESNTGRGNEVRIKDGDTEVRYCHLSAIYVKNGQRVEEGQQIGTCGWTGYVIPKSPAGAHLHFEVLINGVYVDPIKVIEGGQVEKINKGDVDNMWDWMYGKKPSQADYDAWVGKSFKEWAYNKAQPEFKILRSAQQYVPYNGKQLFTKKG